MATNKMAAILNKKWSGCNQDYKLLIKGIIIIPSVVCLYTMTEHFFIYHNIYILNKIYLFSITKQFYNNSECITDATFKL